MPEVVGLLSRNCIRLISLLLLPALLSCARSDSDDRLRGIVLTGIPDLAQQGPDFGLPGDGRALCAPVAVSNSLSWLAGGMNREEQIVLVSRLAGPDYMDTRVETGTPLTGLVRGLDKYLKEEGYRYRRLEYTGWQRVPRKYRAGEPLSLEWLVHGLSRRSAVWLNLGWYENAFPGYYRRRMGHWVVLVGYQEGKLIIQDPGLWAGPGVDPQVLEARVIRPLVLKTSYRTIFPAPVLIELKGARSPNEKRAYIDGALILELK